MKTLLVTLLAVSFLAVSLAHAADEKKPTAQQEKMKVCNSQAGEKKLEGDARNAFVRDCLNAAKPATQQDKMKACNKDAGAKGLKGEDRKAFMNTCLSGERKS